MARYLRGKFYCDNENRKFMNLTLHVHTAKLRDLMVFPLKDRHGKLYTLQLAI